MSATCRRCEGPLGDNPDDADAELCGACGFLALAERAGLYDLSAAADKRRRDLLASAEGRAITCPVCEMTSYHPMDVREGFCGNCHAWTGAPLHQRPVMFVVELNKEPER